MSRKWMWTLVLALVSLFSDSALAVASSPLKADFNGDGYADLAIGAPSEDITGADDSGVVHVAYGSASGITTAGNVVFRQGVNGVPDQAEAYDYFGEALAAGDFNGDSYVDLAIGAWGESFGSISAAGSVIVLYGSINGLTTAGSNHWYQGTSCWFAGSILGQRGTWDYFGGSLAAGDFDGDSYDDLAIGASGETGDAGNVPAAGAVHVIYGSSVGLNCGSNQLWHQGSAGIEDSPENSDYFGSALAAGDFNGDSNDDLAIGIPWEDHSGCDHAGAVSVILGVAGSGLSSAGDQFWHQDSYNIGGVAATDDWFGHALAAGHFNGDVYADLAIGTPYDDPVGVSDVGSVNILYGSVGGLTGSGSQLWNQITLGGAHAGERFGWSLAAANFGQGGWDDLAVGIPEDEVSGVSEAGSVHVLYSTFNGLTATGNQVWNQASSGIAGGPEYGDWFGIAVTTGDYNGDGYSDLAIGAAYEDSGFVDAGVVHVLKASALGGGIIASGSLLLDQDMLGEVKELDDRFGNRLSR